MGDINTQPIYGEDYDVIRRYQERNLLNVSGISVVSIEVDEHYYDTEYQIKNINKKFEDKWEAKSVIDTDKVSGLFGYSKPVKKSVVQAISRTGAGPDFGWDWPNNPQLLDNANIESVEKQIDKLRQGTDIRFPKHQVGIVKISAGTAGHIVQPYCFGVNTFNVGDSDKFIEIDYFNPVNFINLQDGEKSISELITFPIVTSDANQLENYILNGIIEPFPIRPVIALFSINTPFEPHSVKGQFGNGNLNTRFASSQVVSIDYFNNSRKNESVFLDAVDIIGMNNDENDITVNLGPSIGYYSIDENHLDPFEDTQHPREILISTSYSNDMINALRQMKPGGTTYVTRKEKSFSTGFMYDNIGPAGVDSIAFGGLTY